MRVTIDGKPGTFLGLLNASGCDRCGDETPSAIVQMDESPFGLFLTNVHPSVVKPMVRVQEGE